MNIENSSGIHPEFILKVMNLLNNMSHNWKNKSLNLQPSFKNYTITSDIDTF